MDSRTGEMYPSIEAARKALVPKEYLVALEGEARAVRSISDAVKQARRAQSKRARASRKRNR